MATPRRILILRTSRFASDAITWARRTWPDATLRVAHQPGAAIEQELESAGISAPHRLDMGVSKPVSVRSLLCSRWGWRALMWRPNAVVIQWWNANGEGHERTDLAALTLAPLGFFVVLQGGTAMFVPATRRIGRPLSLLCRRLARRVAGLALVMAIAGATVMVWPAAAWHRARERRRLAAAL